MGEIAMPATTMLAGLRLGHDHAGADGAVGHAVDDDKGAGGAVGTVVVVGNWAFQRQFYPGDLVQRQLAGLFMGQGVHVLAEVDAGKGTRAVAGGALDVVLAPRLHGLLGHQDRKSTRLNSSHVKMSYAVFCLKKRIYIERKEYVASQ